MADAPWQILVVDDEVTVCEQITEHFDEETLDDSGRLIEVTSTQNFKEAFAHLESKKIDAVILDVKDEGKADAGLSTLAEIQARRFVPVVFYTANPTLVNHLKSTVIRVVEKTQGLDAILTALREIVATGIPSANRAILRHVEHVQRDFMWKSHEILAAHHKESDKLAIAFLMARRLAASLESTGIEHLAKDMGHDGKTPPDAENVHPMFLYIIPPISGLHTGALYRDGEGKHWVVLSNACDLELRTDKKDQTKTFRKADYVLLAECRLVSDQKEHIEWSKKQDGKDTIEALQKLIGNNRSGGQPERFFFLPAAFGFPDLVVDVQSINTMSPEAIEKLKCLAIIDSPYRESLISRFTRFYARIGTPNIDAGVVLDRLKQPKK